MHLGIKQPQEKDVTGTFIILNDDTSLQESLKKSKDGVILHPQPHDTPNDPLNWPIWRRDLCLLVVGVQTFLGGGQSPLMAAGMSLLAVEFNTTSTVISYLVGIFMLSLGLGSVFASPTAVLYGKRLVYLLGILLFFIGSIVAATANSYGQLMAGRIIIGFGASPTESLPSSTITEIYFAHERAYRIGIYTMLMLGGKNIVPLLSGLVFQYLNRHWLFWILGIFLGANLIFTFFFVPETYWERRTFKSWEEPKPYSSTLAVYSGRHSNVSWWKVALRPFVLYTYPSVLFGSLVYSFSVVWLIVISEVISEIFKGEGYNYSQRSVGLFYISPFVGGILGSLVAGLASDKVSRYFARKNGGVYEPEYRLVTMVPASIFIILGLAGFGWSSYDKDLWIGPVIFFGSVAFGCSMASTTAITFTVDSYKMYASEALVSLNFCKNLLGFIFSFFNNSFLHHEGGRSTFGTYAAIQCLLLVFTVPLYIYGKRGRAWTDRMQMMRGLSEEQVPELADTTATNEKDFDTSGSTSIDDRA